jgi:tRNA wybutosine-synthesizing protein 3
MSLSPGPDGIATPVVAVRTTALALDVVVGALCPGQEAVRPVVTEEYLMGLVRVVLDRFKENEKRRDMFAEKLGEWRGGGAVKEDEKVWEDRRERRERLRAEGLRKRDELRRLKEEQPSGVDAEVNVDVDAVADLDIAR